MTLRPDAFWSRILYPRRILTPPPKPLPYLPSKIVHQILLYLSIRDLWTGVRPSSPRLAAHVNYIMCWRHLPSLTLISRLRRLPTLHVFRYPQLFFRAPTRELGAKWTVVLEARHCGRMFYPRQCSYCIWEKRNLQRDTGSMAAEETSEMITGRVDFRFSIRDPQEEYQGRFPVVVKCDAVALDIHWDVRNSRLRLNWERFMDGHCVATTQAERKEKWLLRKERVKRVLCSVVEVKRMSFAVVVLAFAWLEWYSYLDGLLPPVNRRNLVEGLVV